MKAFNKVIQVEVSVDTIANNLLETMLGNFPHRELVVESIIGGASNHQLSLLYNSLNGYTNDINFKVNDIIVPNDFKAYGYWEGADQPESYRAIQEAKIIEMNIYAKEKICIEYSVPNSKGESRTSTKWVSHLGCELVINPEALA